MSRPKAVEEAIALQAYPSRAWCATWEQSPRPAGKTLLAVRIPADRAADLKRWVKGSHCNQTAYLHFAVQRLLATVLPDSGLSSPESAQEESARELQDFLREQWRLLLPPREAPLLLPKGSIDLGVLPSGDHSIRLSIAPTGPRSR